MSVTDEDQPQSPTQNQLKQCRICLDDENSEGIISPCLCSGNSAYVHRECLNNWRSMNKNGKGFKSCDICQFEYIIETVNSDREADRKRLIKYYLFVTRDLTLMMLLIQLVIFGLAYILKRFDRNNHDIQNLFPESIKGLFIVYYLSAITLLLAIIGLVALIVFCLATNGRNFNCSNIFSGKGGFAVIVGIVIVCALIGVFVGLFLSIIIIKEIMKNYKNKLWLRQEAEKYIVKDFQGRRKELEKYKNHSTSTEASIINIDQDEAH